MMNFQPMNLIFDQQILPPLASSTPRPEMGNDVVLFGNGSIQSHGPSFGTVGIGAPNWLLKANRTNMGEKGDEINVLSSAATHIRNKYKDSFHFAAARNIKANENFNSSVRQVFVSFNQARPNRQLNVDDRETYALVEALFQRNVTEWRRKQRRKSRDLVIALPAAPLVIDPFTDRSVVGGNEDGNSESDMLVQDELRIIEPNQESDSEVAITENIDNDQYPQLNDGDLVFVSNEEHVLQYVGKIINVLPVDAMGMFLRSEVEVKPLMKLVGNNLEDVFLPVKCSKSRVRRLDVPLSDLQLKLTGYTQAEEQANLYTFGNDNLAEQCVHKPGDFILLDLKEVYCDYWPLIAKIDKVLNNGKKFRVTWYEGIISGTFDVWMFAGKPHQDTLSAKCHYHCGFSLENGFLPKSAIDAIAKQIRNNKK